MIKHPIPPIFNEHSRILILGSFPSVKSREQRFFYGHRQNRFWPLIASLCGEPVPLHDDIPGKTALLLRHGIALWDTIASCEIRGSSDSSITNVVPNDINIILNAADIRQIFCNGGKSYELYRRYLLPATGRDAVRLPSTSPANAACTMEKLRAAWMPAADWMGDAGAAADSCSP